VSRASRPRIPVVLPVPPTESKLERDFPVAVVVGASRGLGLLMARELDREGFRVVIAARHQAELDRAAEELRADGARVATDVCDVADADQVEALIERTETSLGPIEVLICVAGVIQAGPLSALSREHFVEAIDVMLWGPVNCGLAMAPRMRARGRGRIGVVTSVGGRISAPHLLPYSTAKFGAVGFTRGLRSELAGTGVTVTCAEPGLMRVGSHIRAKFVGNHGREFAWFATADSLPILSIDGERAAVRMVRAVLSGRAVVTVTPIGFLAPRVDALFPNLTAGLLGLATRLLPDDPGTPESGQTVDGGEARRRASRPTRFLLNRVLRLSDEAAEQNNEPPGGAATEPTTNGRRVPRR
jgi:NAD(P)-dependent dehydrogenase (short-subunit alcohol dehydrogenase family)